MKPFLLACMKYYDGRNKNDGLTAERCRELFDYNPGKGVLIRRPRKGPGTSTSGEISNIPIPSSGWSYQRIRADNIFYTIHRLIWLHVYGEWPLNSIDHINGCSFDNRIENLRDVTTFVNMQNQRRCMKNSKTGLLGVFPFGDKFCAQITVSGKTVHIGLFNTALEGHNAYLEAKRRWHDGCTI